MHAKRQQLHIKSRKARLGRVTAKADEINVIPHIKCFIHRPFAYKQLISQAEQRLCKLAVQVEIVGGTQNALSVMSSFFHQSNLHFNSVFKLTLYRIKSRVAWT